MSNLKPNSILIISFLLSLLISLSLVYLYSLNVGGILSLFKSFVSTFTDKVNLFLLFLFIILGVICHELIHALFFYTLGGANKNIKIGFNKNFLMPYTTCNDVYKLSEYRIIIIMPFLILGILPLFLAFIFKHNNIFLFGYFCSLISVGDLIIYFISLKYSGKISVKDHPYLIGFEIL
jgi:hypothetical protein